MSQILMSVEDREAELLGRLPAQARERFEALRQRRDDAHVLLLAASGAAREAREMLRTLQQQESQTKFARKRDLDAEASAARRVEAQRIELAHRQALVARRETTWSPVAGLVANLIEQMRDVPAGQLVEAGAPDVRLRKGETPAQAIEARRARLAELAHERTAVRAAPVPLDVAKERARAAVEALVAAGRPPIVELFRPTTQFAWPLLQIDPQIVQGRVDGQPFTTAAEPPPVPNALAIATWVDPDRLLAKMLAEIDAIAPDDALSDGERAERLAALDAEVLQGRVRGGSPRPPRGGTEHHNRAPADRFGARRAVYRAC
jgi:hypothetical protein